MALNKLILIMLVLVFSLIPVTGLGKTLYVTDDFKITMRTGPSLENKVIGMLASGMPLEVLEELPEWLQIRTPEGKQGWVLKHYTMQRLPNKEALRQLQDRFDTLQDKLQKSEQKTARLEQEKTELQSRLQKVQQELKNLEQKHQTLLEDSGNIKNIKQELRYTQTALDLNRDQLSRFRAENQELRSQQELRWFLAGAGTIALAALTGFILGRINRKKSKKVFF